MLCDIAKISRAAYYKLLNREDSKLDIENKMLTMEISKIYSEVDGIYGYRRMTMNLNRRLNKKFNLKRIYRLMKLSLLQSVIRRKRKRYIKSTPQHVAENLLNREFSANKLNEKWVTDVTELKYGKSQKAYLVQYWIFMINLL